MRQASCVARQAAGAGAELEIRGLQLQRDARGREIGLAQAQRHLFGEAQQHRDEVLGIGDVLVEGGLGGDALGVALGLTVRRSSPRGEPGEAQALLAIAAGEMASGRRWMSPMSAQPVLGEALLRRPCRRPG